MATGNWRQTLIRGITTLEVVTTDAAPSATKTVTIYETTSTTAVAQALVDAQAGQVKLIGSGAGFSSSAAIVITVTNCRESNNIFTIASGAKNAYFALQFDGQKWELLETSQSGVVQSAA